MTKPNLAKDAEQVARDMFALRILLSDYLWLTTTSAPYMISRGNVEMVQVAEIAFAERFMTFLTERFADADKVSDLPYPFTLTDLAVFTRAQTMVYALMHPPGEEEETPETVLH